MGEVRHCSGWITILKGVVWCIKFENNDKSLLKKIKTLKSERAKS